jgi:hypothetical protein
MARSRGFWRLCFGWCLLLCVLPSVEAATKSVNVPSLSKQVSSGTASLGDSVLTMNTAIEGEFIPAPTKNVPVRGILGGTEFGLNTIIPKAKNLVRGGLVGIAAGYAFDKMLDGLGWVMTDGAVAKKSQPTVPPDISPGDAYWQGSNGAHYADATGYQAFFVGYWGNGSCSYTSDRFMACQAKLDNGATPEGYVELVGGTCTPPRFMGTHGCVLPPTSPTTPLTDSDLDFMDAWIANQNSDFVKNLLRQSCEGSNNPEGCYQSLRKRQLDLKGPSTVDAGSTTTTTTHPNADGTTSTTVTTTNNKYNITYSPTTMTYTNHSITTTSTDGKPGDSTSTDENPGDEADPEDNPDDDTNPSPCAGNGCDGPAYTKLYEPTKDTKEKFLDSYAAKVKSLPILTAVSGFFTVSASAGCPAWSTTVSFDVLGYSFNTNLVFDFHCQPWFVSMAAYAKIVMSIVCAYLAFRQAILD